MLVCNQPFPSLSGFGAEILLMHFAKCIHNENNRCNWPTLQLRNFIITCSIPNWISVHEQHLSEKCTDFSPRIVCLRHWAFNPDPREIPQQEARDFPKIATGFQLNSKRFRKLQYDRWTRYFVLTVGQCRRFSHSLPADGTPFDQDPFSASPRPTLVNLHWALLEPWGTRSE